MSPEVRVEEPHYNIGIDKFSYGILSPNYGKVTIPVAQTQVEDMQSIRGLYTEGPAALGV